MPKKNRQLVIEIEKRDVNAKKVRVHFYNPNHSLEIPAKTIGIQEDELQALEAYFLSKRTNIEKLERLGYFS